jgi:hypothetical protein
MSLTHVTETRRSLQFHTSHALLETCSAMSYEPPLKITIAIPNEFPKGFGANSTGKRGGNLRVRCTNKEYDAIQHEADLLDISLAMFCRWCSVHVASKLSEHRKAKSTSISIGEDNEYKPTNPRRKKRKNTRTM